jgi:hypothetical protein
VSHQHLAEFLAILHDVFHDYDIIVKPKKCGILTVKKHFKITSEMGLRRIPVLYEYCYLGVTMDMTQADFTLTWKKIKKRYNYLCANMQ